MRIESAGRSRAGILLLNFLIREQDADASVHGLLVLAMVFTE